MATRIALAAAVATALLGISVAASAQTAAGGLQPFVGVWKLDPTQTRMGVLGPATPTALRDPTFTWTFAAKPYGLEMDVYEKYPLPAPSRVLQINADGAIHPCEGDKPCLPSGGNPREQAYAYHKVDDHMISRLFYVKGKIAEYDTYAVSKDGKTLTITAWHAPTPEYQNVQVFNRQP